MLSTTVISVGRAGKEIGNYDLAGLKEGLGSGYFQPDDFGWYEGLTAWRPLPEIVELLSIPPPPPAAKPPPITFIAPPPTKPPAAQKARQNLKPKKGEVTYVLNEPKPKKKKKPTAPAHSWEDDPATDNQIAFLGKLGARGLPSVLTKGEAHNRIDALLGHSRGQAHSFLSPKQLACLHYYGFDVSSLNYDEAKALLDQVHDSPESFSVPEPWETAKYRLYPRLYPNPNRSKNRGCLAVCLLAVCLIGALSVASNWSQPNESPPAASPVATLPVQPHVFPSVSTGPAIPVPALSIPSTPLPPRSESDYHGTSETNFAKDWVIVDGKRLDGITAANPASGAQVAILYSDGGKDVPASELPQGFLDTWKLTPTRLRAVESNQ